MWVRGAGESAGQGHEGSDLLGLGLLLGPQPGRMLGWG